MWGKDSGWLNFDLGDDFVLRRIVVLAQNKSNELVNVLREKN